jgi:hypothetical protein
VLLAEFSIFWDSVLLLKFSTEDEGEGFS